KWRVTIYRYCNTSSSTARNWHPGGPCQSPGFVSKCGRAPPTRYPMSVSASTFGFVGVAPSWKDGQNGVLSTAATGKRGGFSGRRFNEENPLPKGLLVQKRKSVAAPVLRLQSLTRGHDSPNPKGAQGRGSSR